MRHLYNELSKLKIIDLVLFIYLFFIWNLELELSCDQSLLLFLLLLSYMVVLIRKLVNKSSFITIKALLSNKLVQSLPSIDMNMNMTAPRGRLLSHPSIISRKFSISSIISSISYHKRIEIQSSNPS